MKKGLRIPTLVFYAMTAFVVVVGVFCFAKGVSWVNQSFAGFLLYKEPYVGTYSSNDWPGPQAGLRTLDRIIAVDGQQVSRSRDLVAALRDKEPRTLVHYTVESKGQTLELALPVATFSVKDFLLIFIPPFLIGIFLYTLGFIVYLLKPNTKTSWVFLLGCLTVGVYMASGFEILSSYHLVRVHYGFLSFFPAFYFHLGLIFPERKEILKRFPALEYLIYVPAVILFAAFQIHFSMVPSEAGQEALPWVPAYKTLSFIARIFTLFCLLSLVTFLFHAIHKALDAQARQRARMILFGVAMAFAPVVIGQALVSFARANIPWNLLGFFIIFFPASIAYSIVMHNLFDADAIIKRTVGYVVVTVIVVGAYVGLSLGLNVVVGEYHVAQSKAFPIIFTVGVILVFNPLRNRIQSVVDRLFFRKEYDYGVIVDKISGAMTSLLDLGQILRRLVQTFTEDMFIDTSSVILLAPAGNAYQVYLAEGDKREDVERISFKRDEPLMGIVEAEKRELTKYDLLEDPKYKEICGVCEQNFDSLNATLMVPLVFQDKVVGLLNLGEKKSGKAYNREDVNLLRTLAHQSAVAIENARLFQENLEKQRMEEELSIARDLQMSMLPDACPQVKGFHIAASSTPAREVGGDFYDFIEMGEEKIGFVVGDVTGKSVSGALVMSASRSVFRMLSEEKLTVGDIMARANRRLKKDIKTGMFVALLYAVLDARKGKVNLCSAGQTQPIHFSARDGEAKLVDTKGDKFPLGILDQADYQETEIWLPPGDTIVFYTDGIVEAMNEQKEIFGFERLLELVKDAGSVSAEELHQEILDRVSEFVGTAEQHDDLTVIVVSMER